MHLLKTKKEAIRRGVKFLDRILVIDLVTSDGKVRGAVGFHTREGHFYLFKAKAVIIATGTFGGGGGNTNLSLTGDGIAMALRAGAELRNMEFGKTEVMTFMPGGGPGFVYIFNNPQPNYIITNTNGEQFLEKYEMGRRLPGRRYFGPPWRVQHIAMLQECKQGRGPCYVDFRMPDTAVQLREFYGSQFDKTLRQVTVTGTTLDKIKYELGIICAGNGQGGGIRIDVNGQSSLSGLYAAGVASDLCGAAQYTIPSTLAGATITGYRAGQTAAKYALTQPQPVVDEGQVDNLKRQTYAPLNRKQGTTYDEIHMKIMDAWLNVDLRNEARLKKAHEEFEGLEKGITELVAEDYHELVKCHKIKNYLQCSQAVADTALMRRETRLEHVREDYPLTDNREWLKWVIIRRAGDKLRIYLENIPIERWKFKPEPGFVNRLSLKEEVSR